MICWGFNLTLLCCLDLALIKKNYLLLNIMIVDSMTAVEVKSTGKNKQQQIPSNSPILEVL